MLFSIVNHLPSKQLKKVLMLPKQVQKEKLRRIKQPTGRLNSMQVTCSNLEQYAMNSVI